MLEAYTAGFLDADGSVSLSKIRKAKPDYMRIPLVEFYNCDRGILDTIAARWGGRVSGRMPVSEKHNISYSLAISGNAALACLKDVAPYMLHEKKSQRARLLVEHYKNFTPRNGHYTPELIEQKTWLVEQVMGLQMRGEGAW